MIEILNIQDENGYGLMHGRYDVLAKLPDGVTNGDIIKALFPNCEQKENIHNGYFEMYFDGDFGNPSYMRVREYWWNSPYKKEVEK
jgi:hypothetical protein